MTDLRIISGLFQGALFVLLGALWIVRCEQAAASAERRNGKARWRTPATYRLLGMLFAGTGMVTFAINLFSYLHPKG